MQSFVVKNKRAFMSGLLSGDAFNSFLLQEAVIHMAATYQIDGRINRDFIASAAEHGDTNWDKSLLTAPDAQKSRPSGEDALYDFLPWSLVRANVRDIIKGKTSPASFRFVLQLKPEYAAKLADGFSFVLNIRMDDTGIHIVSGVAMNVFSLDKSADALWDRTTEKFLISKGFEFDIEHT